MKLLIFVACFGLAAAQSPFGIFTFKCAAALNCVDESVCDLFGMIATNAVDVTDEQRLFQTPRLPCRQDSGQLGVCCRDPNYIDPWPALNPVIKDDEKSQPFPAPSGGTGCPSRNRTALPDKNTKYDETDFDAGAGEFPWQGAVLDAAGKLLCTCFFTQNNTCTTTASCVSSLKPEDIKVGVGMYDLANPLKVQEIPRGSKKAQISPCKYIAYDPEYEPATGKRDIAVLHIEKEVEYNYYTLPICLDVPKAIPFFKYDDCVVTGWATDNTYHWADVLLLTEEECEALVPGFDRKRESCARADDTRNVCELFDFGSGFQCRKTGKRNAPGDDIYWLKGVYSAYNNCDPKTQIITYSRIEFADWFLDALKNPLKYSLKPRK